MELEGLEEGEIFEDLPIEIADDDKNDDEGEILPDNEDQPSTNESSFNRPESSSGFWVKMSKTKQNLRDRKTYHYSRTSGYSSPRKRNQHNNNDTRYQDQSSSYHHPLDPLGDFDPRVHSSADDWGGDLADRSTTYGRLLNNYSSLRTKVDTKIKMNKTSCDADHNVVDENSPDQKHPEQEDELNELQLRLEALQSTMEKWKEKSTLEIGSASSLSKQQRYKTGIFSSRSSSDPRRKLDLNNEETDWKKYLSSEGKRSRRRRRKAEREAKSREVNANAVTDWNRSQREKILKLSDPDEQCRQFLNMIVPSRKDVENVSASSSFVRHGIPSEFANWIDLSASSTNEDYSLRNMELDSDNESPQSSQVISNDNVTSKNSNLFLSPSVWNGLVPRRRPPLLPEPKKPISIRPPTLIYPKIDAMQIPAQPRNTLHIDVSNPPPQQDPYRNVDDVSSSSIYADCRDDEEVIILKCSPNSGDSPDMIEEISPEEKHIDVVTIDDDADGDDDETSALREILLKSLKEKKDEKSQQDKMASPKSNLEKTTPSTSSSSISKVLPLSSLARSKSDVLVTVGGNGRRNVEVGRKNNHNNFVPNFLQSNRLPSSSPTKWNSPTAFPHLYVSTSNLSTNQRVVTSDQHRHQANAAANRRLMKNNSGTSIRNLPFIEHKQVLIPLDDDSDDDMSTDEANLNKSSTGDVNEDALNQALKNARRKADVAKQMQMKRLQNAAMVEMLEERLKKCRDDLTNHKDTLSEDSTRLRTLESTAGKRKTDLRLAEMKLQKLKDEIRNVENECASHRVFILRLNKEIQNVQSRVDRSLEMQIVYEKQWKEIQELVARHRTIVERKIVKRRISSHVSADDHEGLIKRRRRAMSSTTKAAAACLKRAKRKSSDGVRRTMTKPHCPESENTFDFISSGDVSLILKLNSSLISDAHPSTTKESLGANESLLNENAKCKRQSFSPLLCFRSYRLTKNFSITSKLPLSALTFCNKIQPNVQFCPFALNGKCFDSNCKWQHECDFKLSEVEAIADLLAFCPSLINNCTDGDSIIKCAEELYSNLKEKMSFEEILGQCALNIREKRQENGIIFERRCWKPSQIDVGDVDLQMFSSPKRQHSVQSSEISDAFSIVSELSDTSSIRYFTPNYQKEVENSPNDVQTWLQWAVSTLNDFSTELKQRNIKTLKILCDALDKNRSDSRLWLNYLILYKNQSSSDGSGENNCHKLNRKALDFAQSFDLYWNLWDGCRNDDVDENLECFEKILSFVNESYSVDDDEGSAIVSGQIFRTVLRMATYLFKNGKISDAKDAMKKRLYKTFPGLDKMSFKLKSLLWSTYIYFEHLDRLPTSLEYYISKDVTSSTEILEGDFEIPWNNIDDEKEVSRISSLFDDAFISCSGSAASSVDTETSRIEVKKEKRWMNVEICWILYKNRINFECKLGRFVRAVQFCDSLLENCEKPFDDLLIISRQCRLLVDCQRRC